MGPAEDFGLSPGLGTGGATEGSEVGGSCGKVGVVSFGRKVQGQKGTLGAITSLI